MQHLDEGRIQAWLDRERSGLDQAETREIERHLATCPTCAATASELEQLDAQSSRLLSSEGMTDRDVPPFETVIARSQGAADPPAARSNGRAHLAWAASIAVALGIGWALNDALAPGREDAAPQGPSVAISPTRSAEAPAAVADQETRAARQRDAAEPTGETEAAGVDMVEAGAPAPPPADRTASVRADEAVETQPGLPAAGLVAAMAQPDSARRTEAAADEVAAVPVAAEPLEMQASTNVDAAADAQASAVVRGRVTDEAGIPVSAAQVYIPGTSIGALSDADGRFAIPLGDSASSLASGPLTLRVERVGYGSETRALDPGEAVSDPLEISLAEQALSLDQIVVTGRAGAVADRESALARRVVEERTTAEGDAPSSGDSDLWSERTRAEAEAEVGFALVTLPDRPIDGIRVTSAGGLALVRIEQRLDDGSRVTLLETRRTPEEVVMPGPDTVASTVRGGVTIVISGDLPKERLEALLRQVR